MDLAPQVFYTNAPSHTHEESAAEATMPATLLAKTAGFTLPAAAVRLIVECSSQPCPVPDCA